MIPRPVAPRIALAILLSLLVALLVAAALAADRTERDDRAEPAEIGDEQIA